MQKTKRQQILDAFLLVMRPVARMLLRYGVGYREFAELTKMAFVDVASSDYGIRGRPTNISRVAVMTGLTRKEVRRLRDNIDRGENTIEVKTTPITDVLHQWHAQKDFLDESGQPLKLPFSGDGATFTQLVKLFGGDVPAGAMRTEMKRVGLVREDEDGNLTVVSRAFRPECDDQVLVTTLVHGAYTLLSNIAHNTDPNRAEGTWTHRIAFTQGVKPEHKGQLKRVTRDRISSFAESIDDIFMTYEALPSDEADIKSNPPIAVGIYYFEEQDESAQYEW